MKLTALFFCSTVVTTVGLGLADRIAGAADAVQRPNVVLDLTNPKATRAYRPILIAHRGGVVTAQSPECSQAAIRKAAEAGYHLVELDIRPTKDHYPVVFHDRNLSPATDTAGQVSDLNLEQLLAIRYRNVNEQISTLDAAMQLCKSLGMGVMLDVKDASSPTMLERVAEIVRKHNMENSTITLNGDPKIAGPLSTVSLVHLRSRDEIPRHRLSTAERPLAGYFWFGLPKDLPEAQVAQWQRDGALVIPAINTFRYSPEQHEEQATIDIRHLRELGVDGFQIDSIYQDRFGLTATEKK